MGSTARITRQQCQQPAKCQHMWPCPQTSTAPYFSAPLLLLLLNLRPPPAAAAAGLCWHCDSECGPLSPRGCGCSEQAERTAAAHHHHLPQQPDCRVCQGARRQDAWRPQGQGFRDWNQVLCSLWQCICWLGSTPCSSKVEQQSSCMP